MQRDEFKKILLNSVKETTQNIRRLNEKSLGKDTYDDEFEYEATYKAHLYHVLLKNGIDYGELRLEMQPGSRIGENEHIDLWYTGPNDQHDYLIEVKQVFELNSNKDDIRVSEYRRERDGRLQDGIIKDVIKLNKSCRGDRHGIMLLSWVNTRVEDKLSLDTVKSSIQRLVKEQQSKLYPERIELLWSSGNRTEYVSLD